ncbi:hypothetical protein [Actinoplanes xinjiangensis]|uniref:hypothetical protein n=1 Tax=Actinoplanes xinjiangensis TaxID=512350 RepID=UPI003415E455
MIMESIRLSTALGYTVGDRLVISAEAFESRVSHLDARRVMVEWPWREVDVDSRNSWGGTLGFPRDSDAYGWCNIPWRLEPDPEELEPGDPCFVGIPPTEVLVTTIEKFEPPADYGFLPRPDYFMEVVPLDMTDDEEAGYVIYLNGNEPIDIQVVGRDGAT